MNVDATIKIPFHKAGLIRDSGGKVVVVTIQKALYQGNMACIETEAMKLVIK